MNKVLVDITRLDFPLLNKVRPIFDDEFGRFGNLAATKHNFFGKTGYVAILRLQDGSLGEQGEDARLSQGAGFTLTDACRCALGEAIERTSGGDYDREQMLFGTYQDLARQHSLLDPDEIPNYLPDQKLNGPIEPISRTTPLWWEQMDEVVSATKIWVPAYLVYMPYKVDRARGEPWVDFSTSTGLACGDTPEMAMHSALMELIERDAFTLNWLFQCPTPAVNSDLYSDYAPWFRCFSADVLVRDVTNDVGVPVVSSYVIRDDSKRPFLSVGAGCALTLQRAAEKAIIEVAGCYNYGARIAQQGEEPITDLSAIMGFKDHAKYWVHHEDREGTKWLCEDVLSPPARQPVASLAEVVELFRRQQRRLFFRELTAPIYRELDLFVVRCYSPDLQPLYVRTGNIHLRSRRLREFSEAVLQRPYAPASINCVPHPFP